MASGQQHTEPSDAALLQGLNRWDHAWAKKDALELQKLLAPDCVLHADGILFDKDLQGAEAILDVHRRYFEKFDFQHQVIERAANPDTKAAFGFWQDHGVHRKGLAGEEETEPAVGAIEGTTIAGMWKLIFNDDCSAVKDIYFLRQLHQEEAEHKLRDTRATAKGGVATTHYPAPTRATAEPSKEAMAAARRAAEGYSRIWQTGNTSPAKDLMEESMRSTDLMHGGEKVGRQAFCDMIHLVFEHWSPQSSSIDVGVSPDGQIALVHWESEGKVPETEGSFRMYGLNMLVIDPSSGKIKESAGFRQLSPEERKHVLKADAFLHGTGPGPRREL